MGKNLTDECYYMYVSGEMNVVGYTSATIGRPREWSLRAKYMF